MVAGSLTAGSHIYCPQLLLWWEFPRAALGVYVFRMAIERVHSGCTYTYAGLCGVLLPKRWLGAAGMEAWMAFFMASLEA